MENLFILLIEDNENDAVMIADTFEQAGLRPRLHEIHDGMAALEYFKTAAQSPSSEWPDLVLLDINMPKKNGFEVLQRMQQYDLLQHLPVIMLTTSNREEDHARALELGALAVLVKPLQLNQLEKTLQLFNIRRRSET